MRCISVIYYFIITYLYYFIYLSHVYIHQPIFLFTNLNLSTLEHRRRDKRQKCMYRIVKGSTPALSTETFFRSQKQTKDTFSLNTDYVSSNFVQLTTKTSVSCSYDLCISIWYYLISWTLRKFQDLACCVVNMCYYLDKEKSHLLLVRKLNTWATTPDPQYTLNNLRIHFL